MHQNWSKLIRTVAHWTLFIITLLYLVTGLGITQYHIVESLTFGLLTKNVAFRMHDSLLVPFIALRALHGIMKPAEWLYLHLRRDAEAGTSANGI